MDILEKFGSLRKEAISVVFTGQSKEFIDSLIEGHCEWGYDTGTVYIGNPFNEGWAVVEFDIESGKPLRLMGDNVRWDFESIIDMVRLEVQPEDDTYQDVWEIHTREGNTYVVVNYIDYESMEGYSMVYGKV